MQRAWDSGCFHLTDLSAQLQQFYPPGFGSSTCFFELSGGRLELFEYFIHKLHHLLLNFPIKQVGIFSEKLYQAQNKELVNGTILDWTSAV
jgi:hypothetical protein